MLRPVFRSCLPGKDNLWYNHPYMEDNIRKSIRRILLEFLERQLPDPYQRDFTFPILHPDVRKAWVLMGMRRSGKTWLAFQHMQLRMRQGFNKETNLYINFEDDRLLGIQIEHLQGILDAYFELYPNHIQNPNLFFCFDEIHVVPGWEKFIRRLIDTEKMQICVTGSSAEMLSRELGTTLGGRAWQQEVFPFSFAEFLQFKKVSQSQSYQSIAQIKHFAQSYLLYGGFPEAILQPTELHTPLIQGYMDAVVLRDIIKRYSIRNADVVQKFLIRILRSIAAPLSIVKMHHSLKSMGISIGKNSLYEYLQYLEDAYAILAVPFFSFSEKARQVNPKKIYVVDTGIITAYSVKNSFEHAARLENAVFMHLRRSYKNICYYKTKKQKKEIDFVVTTPKDEILLFQSCLDMDDEATRQRETSALFEGCQELDLKEGFIITQDHEEEITKGNTIIYCIPFWKWAQKTESAV